MEREKYRNLEHKKKKLEIKREKYRKCKVRNDSVNLSIDTYCRYYLPKNFISEFEKAIQECAEWVCKGLYRL